MTDILYPELSYEIIGATYKVFNSLGYGYNEKYYQKAFALELENLRLKFIQEKQVDVIYNNSKIGVYYLDFLVEDKIIVELKVLSDFRYRYIKQVLDYLKQINKKLAIIIYFTKTGVKYRRIINSR